MARGKRLVAIVALCIAAASCDALDRLSGPHQHPRPCVTDTTVTIIWRTPDGRIDHTEVVHARLDRCSH